MAAGSRPWLREPTAMVLGLYKRTVDWEIASVVAKALMLCSKHSAPASALWFSRVASFERAGKTFGLCFLIIARFDGVWVLLSGCILSTIHIEVSSRHHL